MREQWGVRCSQRKKIMWKDRGRKSVTTGRGKTERRRDVLVGDERKEQAGKMNWS